MRDSFLALLVAGAVFGMASTVVAQDLESLRVHAGSLGEPPDKLPLRLPEISLKPVFDEDAASYTAVLPYSADGISLVAETLGGEIFAAEGVAVDGTRLEFSSWTYSRRARDGAILSFHSLPDGEITLNIGVEGFGERRIYSIVVSRAATASADATLTNLELSPAEVQLQTYALTPEFQTTTRQYALEVPAGANSLVVTATAAHFGSVVEVRGVAADGQPLALDGSVVSGLVPGTNTLQIAVTAEDGTTASPYIVAVTRPISGGDAALHNLGRCSVGDVLSPGQYCSYVKEHTDFRFTVGDREACFDGTIVADEYSTDTVNIQGINISMNVCNESKPILLLYFQASEISGTHNWRIDALP